VSVFAAGTAQGARAAESRAGAILTVRSLTKRFPVRRSWLETLRRPFGGTTVAALSDVSLEVREGEFFGLLGPNGAGKTCLLKTVATLLEPDGGEVRVAGYDVVRDAPRVRSIVSPCLANERSLLWRLSAEENLLFHADLVGIPRAEVSRRIREVTDAVGLGDAGIKLVGQFSSGMLQRLLIARALLTRPRLLLLDEPTRSLDPIAAREFRRFLRKELVEQRGCGVILATHSADEALELCDRVGLLHQGHLLASGTARALGERYVGERFRLVTRVPRHQALRSLEEAGVVSVESIAGADDVGSGQHVVLLRLRQDRRDEAEHVLSALVSQGMPVSRFEAWQPSLADLIAAVVSSERPS
jgi:ABC-2 type transport system ATP-binding protein